MLVILFKKKKILSLSYTCHTCCAKFSATQSLLEVNCKEQISSSADLGIWLKIVWMGSLLQVSDSDSIYKS